jgi:hypothetical protein
MSDESSQDRRMKALWQGQPTEGVRMSIEQVQASAGSFQRKIQWRNAREYVAAAAVVVFFGFQFVRTGDLVARLGFGLIIAGMCYMVWHLYFKGAWRPLPRDAGLSNCIEFQRRELERQRDLLSHVWSWYLGPLIPGLAVLIVDFAFASQGRIKHNGLFVAAYSLFVAGIFFGIAKLNSNAARTLQRRIDELDEARR